MKGKRLRPIRLTGWAFRLLREGTDRPLIMGGKLVVIWLWALLHAGPALADDPQAMYQSSQGQHATHGTAHDRPGVAEGGWEGSATGKAYSERNHHLAGVFVLLIGLSELRDRLALTTLTWPRYLLPASMASGGGIPHDLERS